MRYALFITSIFSVLLAWAIPQDIPVSIIDHGQTPPIKRTVAYTPEVSLDADILTVDYPLSGDIKVDIMEGGTIVWSETASFGMFTLPKLQDGTTYTLVVTINGKFWGGVFTYVTP